MRRDESKTRSLGKTIVSVAQRNLDLYRDRFSLYTYLNLSGFGKLGDPYTDLLASKHITIIVIKSLEAWLFVDLIPLIAPDGQNHLLSRPSTDVKTSRRWNLVELRLKYIMIILSE